MPIRITCPACSVTLGVKDEHAGRAVRCPKCGGVIPASAGAAPAPPAPPRTAPAAPPPLPRAAAAPPPPVSLPPEPEWDPDPVESRFDRRDETPVKPAKAGSKVIGRPTRSKAAAEGEEDDRPPRRGLTRNQDKPPPGGRARKPTRRTDDDDPEEDRPRRRRSEDEEKTGGSKLLLLLGGVASVFLVCGVVGAFGVYHFFIKTKDKPETVVETIKDRSDKVDKSDKDRGDKTEKKDKADRADPDATETNVSNPTPARTGPSGPPKKDDPNGPKPTKPEPADKVGLPVINTSAANLIEAYVENPTDADTEFGGKRLVVTGGVIQSWENSFTATLVSPDMPRAKTIRVTFLDEQPDKLATLKTGSPVKFRAVCTPSGTGAVINLTRGWIVP